MRFDDWKLASPDDDAAERERRYHRERHEEDHEPEELEPEELEP